jgi:tetratricopeptide (TPR) repeat protein
VVQLGLGRAWYERAKTSPDMMTRVQAICNLAECHRASGDYATAERIARQTLVMLRQILHTGKLDASIVRSIGNLALVFYDQGKHVMAAQIETKLLSMMARSRGDEHYDTLIVMSNLAMTLHALKRFADAERMQRQVIDVLQRAHGSKSSTDVLKQRANLAATLASQRRFAEADGILRIVIDSATRSFGSDHPMTLTSRSNLAVSLSSQCRYDEAEPLHREILLLRTKVLGADHPGTLKTMVNLANVLGAGDEKLVESESLLRAAHAACTRTIGSTHPIALDAARSLIYVRSRVESTI